MAISTEGYRYHLGANTIHLHRTRKMCPLGTSPWLITGEHTVQENLSCCSLPQEPPHQHSAFESHKTEELPASPCHASSVHALAKQLISAPSWPLSYCVWQFLWVRCAVGSKVGFRADSTTCPQLGDGISFKSLFLCPHSTSDNNNGWHFRVVANPEGASVWKPVEKGTCLGKTFEVSSKWTIVGARHLSLQWNCMPVPGIVCCFSRKAFRFIFIGYLAPGCREMLIPAEGTRERSQGKTACAFQAAQWTKLKHACPPVLLK